MSRDVSWGLYIGQFTFLVGVAASGVMVVLPYYLHDYKKFGRLTILGEFLAIAAVIMCMLFIFVDLGQPLRVLNVILHPTPNSVMFYDMLVLSGYLFLNLLIGWTVLGAETERSRTAEMGKASDHSLDRMGAFNSYRYGVLVCRYSGKTLLADSNSGCPIPGIGICRRSFPAYYSGFDCKKIYEI